MQTETIFGMLLTILNEKDVTAKKLAAKFEISERTVHRYLNTLELSGVPIYSQTGKNGGIRILNTFRLNNGFLTEQEKAALKETASNINDQSIRSSLMTKLNSI